MRKNTLLSAALFVTLGLSAAVLAQPPGEGPDGGPGGGPGWHHHRGPLAHELHELGLSDAQKASIKQIVEAARPQMRAQFESLRTLHQAVESATPGTAAYQNAVASLAQSASTAASAHVQMEASLRTQIYGVLTDAQKAQLATLIQQHQAKMAEWEAKHPAPPAD